MLKHFAEFARLDRVVELQQFVLIRTAKRKVVSFVKPTLHENPTATLRTINGREFFLTWTSAFHSIKNDQEVGGYLLYSRRGPVIIVYLWTHARVKRRKS